MTGQKQMTILMISPFARPNIGGVEAHLKKLMTYLSEKGHFTYLLTYQPLTTNTKGKRVEKGKNFEIQRVSWFGVGLFPKIEPYFPLTFLYLFPGLFFGSLNFYLRNHHKIDVIHAHGFTAALIAKILKKIHKKRTIISTHAVYSLEKRPLLAKILKFILEDFDAILAVGEPSRQELIEIGLDEKSIKVHPNWIDLNVFKPADRQETKKELDLDGFVVLFVGRFLKKKGVKLLLEASKQLEGNVTFIFIGGGELEEDVKKAEKSQKNVKYVGRLFQDNRKDLEKLIKYYSAADFLVSPYLYDEGFSTVLLEAVACGTPLMLPRRGSPQYFLDESVAVFLQHQPTAEELVSKVNFYRTHHKELAQLQKNCHQFAKKNFSPENAKIILESYRSR